MFIDWSSSLSQPVASEISNVFKLTNELIMRWHRKDDYLSGPKDLANISGQHQVRKGPALAHAACCRAGASLPRINPAAVGRVNC
ncbi:MAG: hypothetical protein ACXWFF_16955 [Methylomonas sp.]